MNGTKPGTPAGSAKASASSAQNDERQRSHVVILGVATAIFANPLVQWAVIRNVGLSLAITGLAVATVIALAARRSRTVMAVVAFNAIAIASVALHVEVFLRIARPDMVIRNLYAIRDGYYVNEPLLDERFTTQEYSSSYRTNVQGLRISSGHDPNREVKTADWLVMGDSFTQGAQVDFEKMYSTLLYRRFPDKVVVNAGVSGLGLGQEYNFFASEARALSPRLVILQLGSFNDFMSVEAPRARLAEHLFARSALARLVFSSDSDGQDLPLGRWTEPFQPSLDGNVDFNVFFNETSSRKRRDLDAFKNVLRAFSSLARERNARLVVVLLPTREQVDRRALDQVLTAYKIAESAVDMRRPNRIVADVSQELGIGFLDLLPAFVSAGEGLFFEQDVHLTERGHEVFANALGDYLEATEGPSRATLLSGGRTPERYPSFSNDGSVIAFQALRDGASELVLADADLSNSRWLTSTAVNEEHPALSPDRSAVAYTEYTADHLRSKAVLLDMRSGARTNLTPEPLAFGAIPSFSHTGRQIAMAEWGVDPSTNTLANPRITVMDLTSKRRTYLTDGSRECWRPVFSPTDTKLAFIEQRDGQFDLKLLDLTTGIETTLTTTPYDEWDPQFTPDGRRIVYAARADGNWDLFMMDISTGEMARLTATRGDEWDPAVSPDGRTLLYGGRFGSFDVILRNQLDDRR